ncbi:Tho complex subunit 7-domain-containing protein [Phyllosticta citribraziliensis]|uniref:Tho complex subunit 7-domain-containing protein n=1 Tax=Phyllosticta citribraziliensis TaxID=989973 RepID=A0ABR1LDZ5_9PEZI
MSPSDFSLLDQAEEDSIHKSRLLPIEQRPFQRITKRLLAADSPIYNPPTSLPTPPPDAATDEDELEAARAKQAADREAWRNDMFLDFVALSDSIVRIQLLRNSNEAERERYAAEKVKIEATSASIRDSTATLRTQLDEARATLARRKKYDELAERITSNRMLRPREDQSTQLQKLEAEIAELEQESRVYAQTWAERREQFGRIVEEGRQMLRLIRDEKEEAERKEGMEGGEETMDEGAEGGSAKAEGSAVGTPRPDAGSQTPNPTQLAQSSIHKGGLLAVQSPAASLAGAASPGRKDDESQNEGRDTDMVESGELAPETDIEEGEAEEDASPGDRMDVS